MVYNNERVKRLLKSELVKRGITTSDLVILLNKEGLQETKSSINSKISRGTFSATFFLQCLSVIGCPKLDIDNSLSNLSIAAEPKNVYKLEADDKK